MTDDLDTLRPEIRDAVDSLDKSEGIDFAWLAVRADLVRVARENDEWQTRCLQFQTERDKARAELTLAHRERDRMFLDAREWATRFGEMEARAEKAEAELAALKDENAQLRDVLADRDMDREMAAHANKELAALKARIAGGELGVVAGPMKYSQAPVIFAEPDRAMALIGQRVALVKVED